MKILTVFNAIAVRRGFIAPLTRRKPFGVFGALKLRPTAAPIATHVGRGFIAPNNYRRVNGALKLRPTAAPYGGKAIFWSMLYW